MNKRRKGNIFQNWIEKYLIEKNYKVHNQKPVSTKIKNQKGEEIWVSKRNDLFGTFDLIALNENEIKFISATLDTNIKKRTKQFLEFLNNLKNLPSSISLELWVKKENKIIIKKFDFNSKEFKDIGILIRKKFYELK